MWLSGLLHCIAHHHGDFTLSFVDWVLFGSLQLFQYFRLAFDESAVLLQQRICLHPPNIFVSVGFWRWHHFKGIFKCWFLNLNWRCDFGFLIYSYRLLHRNNRWRLWYDWGLLDKVLLGEAWWLWLFRWLHNNFSLFRHWQGVFAHWCGQDWLYRDSRLLEPGPDRGLDKWLLLNYELWFLNRFVLDLTLILVKDCFWCNLWCFWTLDIRLRWSQLSLGVTNCFFLEEWRLSTWLFLAKHAVVSVRTDITWTLIRIYHLNWWLWPWRPERRCPHVSVVILIFLLILFDCCFDILEHLIIRRFGSHILIVNFYNFLTFVE